MSGRPRIRTVRVDPYAPCDIARKYSLTANQTWLLTLLALQAEYRSNEWPGTLSDLASAARCSRKTATKDVDVLVAKGLLEEIEPFRSGTDGRVRVLVRDRIVLRRNASFDANGDGPDRDPLATTSRPLAIGMCKVTRMTRGKRGVAGTEAERE